MRLIDGDALFLHLNDYALQEAPIFDDRSPDAYNAVVNCMRAIEEANTIKPVIVVESDSTGRQLLKIDYNEVERNAKVIHMP